MARDSYAGIYVFCKIKDDTLARMLKKEITMEEVFRSEEFIYQTYIAPETGVMHYKQYDAKLFDGSKLLRKGAYYKVN